MAGESAGPYVAAGAAVVVAAVAGWWQRKQAHEAARPEAQEALNDGYGALVADLRTELDRRDALHGREIASLVAQLATMERRSQECEARQGEMQARIDHLERVVERRHIDIGPPDPPGTERRTDN